jgi:hypothetical protein
MKGFSSRCVVIFVLSLILLGVPGCSTPYVPPKIEASGASPTAFPGIMSYARMDNLRIVWIHGMCSHGEEWPQRREEQLMQAVGLRPGHKSILVDASGAKRVTYRHQVGGHDLEIRYLLWSPLTLAPKETVSVGDSGDLIRAKLNRELKTKLINDCFADAYAYLGRPGDAVRRWVKSEVCTAIGGTLAGSHGCALSRERQQQQVLFVAESLGSAILSDALISIWETSTSQRGLAERMDNVKQVFLLANQLPLFTVARRTSTDTVSSARANALDTLIDVFVAARATEPKTRRLRHPAPLHFVAFTDPNDLLSYRLITGRHVPPDILVTNVLVSNDVTYFGLLERPDAAHCGYGWNPFVIALLAEGSAGLRSTSFNSKPRNTC